MAEYYFPDIIKEVVGRVNDFFSTRDTDPFEVDFDRGLYQQVGNDRTKKEPIPLFVWLIMPFTELTGKDESYCSDVTFQLIIAIKTESNYTMDQREQLNFFPRIIPVYEKLKEELMAEQKLMLPSKISGAYRLLPYWGGGDVASAGAPNIWQNYVDAIEFSGITLKKAVMPGCNTIFKSF